MILLELGSVCATVMRLTGRLFGPVVPIVGLILPFFRLSSIIQSVNQIHNYFDDSVLFIGFTLGNKKSQSYQSVVCQTFAAIGAIEDTIHA